MAVMSLISVGFRLIYFSTVSPLTAETPTNLGFTPAGLGNLGAPKLIDNTSINSSRS